LPSILAGSEIKRVRVGLSLSAGARERQQRFDSAEDYLISSSEHIAGDRTSDRASEAHRTL